MAPGGYNQNVQIVQHPDYVALLNEMVHNTRVIRWMDVQGQTCRSGRGESRAHWEGETLVIDTKNFHQSTSLRGSSPNLHLVERIRRVDADHLVYEFTVDDPTTWTKPWTAQVPMMKPTGSFTSTHATKAITACRDPERRAGDREERRRKPQLAAVNPREVADHITSPIRWPLRQRVGELLQTRAASLAAQPIGAHLHRTADVCLSTGRFESIPPVDEMSKSTTKPRYRRESSGDSPGCSVRTSTYARTTRGIAVDDLQDVRPMIFMPISRCGGTGWLLMKSAARLSECRKYRTRSRTFCDPVGRHRRGSDRRMSRRCT